MKAHTERKKSPTRVQRIVLAYRLQLGRRGRPLSFARFAAGLNDIVEPYGLSISYQSIKNWEDGVHLPDQAFILRLSICAPAGSWQSAFAMDLLAALWPELYQPVSEAGGAREYQ